MKHEERVARVWEIIQNGSSTHTAGIQAQVAAIVEAWEVDNDETFKRGVESGQTTFDPTYTE